MAGRRKGSVQRPPIRGEPLERVMRYVQFDPFGGCWLWDSGTTFNGHMEYPVFNLEPARSVRVSRFMWERHHGPILAGKIIRHTCDVSMCINPDHLRLGTHLENMADMRERGRTTKGRKAEVQALTCEECGREFLAASRRWCGSTCRGRAWKRITA